MIRVLVVDDHAMVREGLASVLAADGDIEVVGAAANGAEAVDLVRAHVPDVVVMDLSMPVMDGVAATRAVRDAAPGTRVLVLTSFTDRDRVRRAIEAGAVGYQLKDAEPADLRAAVRSVEAGFAPLDPRVAGALLPTGDPAHGLSARERQVLQLVTEGRANKQIASALGISEATVKAHLGRIFREIGVADRTSAALWARDHL
ncbi:MAG: response regulator transcription factor [Microbacterium sp.]|uniref:response regulator n=1 Tax=Microbacterium sp. TaxID=51671 RepID=UPI001AC2A0A3|nr:response regulator transcription factor [Microbacterium sp.]MBN9153705.1 response regulator transcription factor [Microbacterium sp.]MBN9171811.1 response regulator transcription factor [Microbacterium sp.]MBN9188032.1 response regulator transcription factor [Microbacterium sp.]